MPPTPEPTSVELFKASGLTLNSNSDTVTANVRNNILGSTEWVGEFGPIDISQIKSGLLVVSVSGLSGTTPGLAVFFDCQDGYGNWILTSNATAISGAVLNSTGTVYGNITTGYTLTNKGRIRWVVTGTTPSFTGVSFSLWGE